MTDKCELCGSEHDELNFHHLIPRTLHSSKLYKKKYTREFMNNNGIWICEHYCHKQIHRFLNEKEMGLKYNTIDLLLNHPEIKKFIDWRKKRV